MLKILWKRGEIAPEEQFLLSYTIFCNLVLYFYVKIGIRFSLRDKRLVEITEVEITRVDCTTSTLRTKRKRNKHTKIDKRSQKTHSKQNERLFPKQKITVEQISQARNCEKYIDSAFNTIIKLNFAPLHDANIKQQVFVVFEGDFF